MRDDLTTIATYSQPSLAHLARATLEARGIPAWVADDNLVSINYVLSLAVGGVKLMVDHRDAEAACAILEADNSAELAEMEQDLPPEEGDLCPKCGSGDIELLSLTSRFAALSYLTTLPLIWFGRRARCRECGHKFKA